ncbi:MAG: hypothetical protein JXQ27_17635 [Acidobacteria bacterium]|nr:hypothetical protein [Acidobacteriota bacterium]
MGPRYHHGNEDPAEHLGFLGLTCDLHFLLNAFVANGLLPEGAAVEIDGIGTVPAELYTIPLIYKIVI